MMATTKKLGTPAAANLRGTMTVKERKQLADQVERTLAKNRVAIAQSEKRSERLERAAARSPIVVERAVRRLREGV